MLLFFLWLHAELIVENFHSHGAKIRYCRSKKTKAIKILCLPGAMTFLERAQPFWDALDEAGLDVCGLECRDHGGSSARHKKDPLKLDTNDFFIYIKDLHHFITTHLKGEKFILVGSSFGGHLALRYIQEYGDDQIHHVALIAPMVDVNSPFSFLPRSCLPAVVRMLSWFKSPTAAAPGFDQKIPDDIIQKEQNDAHREILTQHKDKIITRLSLAWIDSALRSIQELSKIDTINVPITVFLGKHENVVNNQASINLLASKAPKTTFHFLDCPHRVLDHQFDEVVNEISSIATRI